MSEKMIVEEFLNQNPEFMSKVYTLVGKRLLKLDSSQYKDATTVDFQWFANRTHSRVPVPIEVIEYIVSYYRECNWEVEIHYDDKFIRFLKELPANASERR